MLAVLTYILTIHSLLTIHSVLILEDTGSNSFVYMFNTPCIKELYYLFDLIEVNRSFVIILNTVESVYFKIY